MSTIILIFVFLVATAFQYAVYNDRYSTEASLSAASAVATTSFDLRSEGRLLNREVSGITMEKEQSIDLDGDGLVHNKTRKLLRLAQVPASPLAGGITLHSRTWVSRASCSNTQHQILTEVLAKVAKLSLWAHNASKMDWLFDPEHREDREQFFEIFRSLSWRKVRKAANYYAGVHNETTGVNRGMILVSCHQSLFCRTSPNLILDISPRSDYIITCQRFWTMPMVNDTNLVSDDQVSVLLAELTRFGHLNVRFTNPFAEYPVDRTKSYKLYAKYVCLKYGQGRLV